MANNDNKQQQIQIEVPNEEMQGRYANLAVITHSPNEFFIDMILLAPNTPKARVQSRVVMTPENAKQLMFALQQNVKQYESVFGEIKQHAPQNGHQASDGIIDFPLPKGQA